jgi:hypothetical protein
LFAFYISPCQVHPDEGELTEEQRAVAAAAGLTEQVCCILFLLKRHVIIRAGCRQIRWQAVTFREEGTQSVQQARLETSHWRIACLYSQIEINSLRYQQTW